MAFKTSDIGQTFYQIENSFFFSGPTTYRGTTYNIIEVQLTLMNTNFVYFKYPDNREVGGGMYRHRAEKCVFRSLEEAKDCIKSLLESDILFSHVSLCLVL